jgi:arylsulfatase A-like enzyme
VVGRYDALAPRHLTLPEILRAGGFETLWVVTNGNSGPRFGFAQGIDHFATPDLYAGYPDGFSLPTAEGVTRKGLQLVDERATDEPFFLFVHYVDPHDPYLPHPGLLAGPEPPGRFDGSRTDLKALDRTPSAELTEADYDRIKYLYAGEVKYCDSWVGELLRGLEERGLRDDVLVVVTADHGEELWDHGARAHGATLYEEMIRVPLILDFPSSAGELVARVDRPVSLVDVAPTILAVAGLPPAEELRGVDLTPLAAGARQAPRANFVYSEMDLDGRSLEAVRHGDSKLIRDRGRLDVEALELYDLARDPSERCNLARQSPQEAARLQAALRDIARDLRADARAPLRVSAEGLEPELLENLRALGYLGGADEGVGAGSPAAAFDLAREIDFSRPDHAAAQLLRGFYEVHEGRRWMAGQASVLLGRSGEKAGWRLEGWIDLALHERESLTIVARADGGELRRKVIDRSGHFTFDGAVDAGSASAVRLDFECDHTFLPAAREGRNIRSLCAVVTSIRLD